MYLKISSFVKYFFFISIIILFFDFVVFRHWLGFGYPRNYVEENIRRYPAPYVMFTGKPSANGHNALGFRGASFEASEPDDFRIAFFGGSTGYHGDPPIAKVIETELNKKLDANFFVSNYSVISSNHRQHLHALLEYFSIYYTDLIIFYGGYNETVQAGFYDPRPGYPFNYYYQGETSLLFKFLLINSSIIGELDNKYGIFSGIGNLRNQYRPFSDLWNKSISDKYFETLNLAYKVSSILASKYCGKTGFLAFYQPYKVPKKFLITHEAIKKEIEALPYAFDVSEEYEILGGKVFTDIVHVNQNAKNVMGRKIAAVIADQLHSKKLCELGYSRGYFH